jgi:hypothetical protein
MNCLPLVKAWIWISVLATAAGWSLSAIGQLNRIGYAGVCVVLVGLLYLTRCSPKRAVKVLRFNRARIHWRFRHALPLGFALLAFLVLLGGLLYPPTNHTGLTYRTPRVLNWLAEEHWFWIHTPNFRMNNRACGFEWLSAPLLLFTRSDRLLFLLNFFPFLLLPGLIYSVFTRLGVRPRVAWNWMWLIPSGYSFLLQAGTIGNDTFPAAYALAAVAFAGRAWASGKAADWSFAVLSAALLTGAKASNLPLLLPWAILAVPLVRVWARQPMMAIAVALLAALVSFLPTAALNIVYCGDWSGLKLERAGMDMKDPVTGIWGNVLLLLLHNFVPPVFPPAGWWNQSILSLLPSAIVQPLVANFENGFHQVLELQTEDWAGFGFGPSLLVLISFLAAFHYRRRGIPFQASRVQPIPQLVRRLALVSPWIALLAFCIKSGMVTGARLISPYYPLLLPLLLVASGHEVLVRTRWWRRLALAVLVLALPVIVLTPSRPLWPARTILSRLQNSGAGQRYIERGLKAYSVYAYRHDPLADIRALVPANVRQIGFMGHEDDMDISLWRPFGQRRVQHILITDSAAQIRQRKIDYAVVGGANLAARGMPLADWLQKTDAELLATRTATVKVTEGPQPWYFVRFKVPLDRADFN